MKTTNINHKDVIFALDIGTRSIIGTVGVIKEKKFHVICESYIEHEERAMMDGQIHDINLVANGVSTVKKELEKTLGFKLKNVAIAAAGRFLRTTVSRAEISLEHEREIDKDFIRSLELTAVKNAEEEVNKTAAGKLYCVGYSTKSYYLNDYVISNLLSHKGDKAAVEVIATFLPRSVVESLYSVMNKNGLNVINLTLEPIAAMEAAIPKSLRLLNLALIDIGAGTSDIAISSKDSISAYGMVANAGDEVTEVIAERFLVDFNTAERIKKDCSVKDTVAYTDVLGFDNEISSEEILKAIAPVVDKLADDIASRVVELNGGKAPNAVFLVGGGAHTPGLKESLAQKLNLSAQRIAIKGREAVADCICKDNSLGSIGVTVLGIALISIMRLGQDFVDVTLNGKVISMFNSHKHTVSDVMMQAGINPKVLIGKNGKNIRFTLNSAKRIAFGALGTNARITVNGQNSSVDSEVKEGDNIEVIYARDGQDAAPKVYEFIQGINTLSFYLNDIITYLEPTVSINENEAELQQIIKDGDNITVTVPRTLGEYLRLQHNISENTKYFKQDTELKEDYIIQEGDRIYSLSETVNNGGMELEPKDINGDVEKKTPDNMEHLEANNEGKDGISIFVNEQKVYLKNKDKYIFIDVFDYIDFDLTRPQGNLILMLNDSKAGYYDELSQGDVIRIFWE